MVGGRGADSAAGVDLVGELRVVLVGGRHVDSCSYLCKGVEKSSCL